MVYDGVPAFEIGVACDVFGTHYAQEFGVPWYRLTVCGATPSVQLDVGLRMEVPHGLDAIRTAGTVVVLPTDQADQVPEAVLDALRAARARGQRILSLCTGAFVLAAAGILDGRRATTHWAECAELAARYPRVTVDPDVLYVDEGNLLTSAGSAASIDLCLHVVQRDFGREVATRLARELVVAAVPGRRPGPVHRHPDAGAGRAAPVRRHPGLAAGPPRSGGDRARPG